MTEMLNRPGFPLRLSSEPDKKVPEVEDEEYELKWGEHNNQVINIFHQLCQVYVRVMSPCLIYCFYVFLSTFMF